MNNFSHDELLIILGYYYFDAAKNDKRLFQNFVTLFNDSFNRDVSEQVISYQMSLFKRVDSSFNATSNSDTQSEEYNLWEYYILQERVDLLKKMYKDFKRGDFGLKNVFVLGSDAKANKILNEQISNLPFTFIEDKPKELYKEQGFSKAENIRDIQVSSNALALANYQCECSPKHELFLRKDGKHNYTEGHHLIPLEFQDKFDVNLDVEANVVSLCSNCHNHLHYGIKPEEILSKLLTKERQERLKKCGINITFEELVELYK